MAPVGRWVASADERSLLIGIINALAWQISNIFPAIPIFKSARIWQINSEFAILLLVLISRLSGSYSDIGICRAISF
jgi:hypothetical protein